MIFSKQFWTEGVGSFIIAIIIAFTIRWALMEAYVIPTGSMLPSLLINDHIFVNKSVYGLRVPFTEKWLVKFDDPERGEVVVFKSPENKDLFYIKRIVGVPGDKVYYENGNLYVNDQLVEKNIPQKLKSDFNWLTDLDFKDEGPGAKTFYTHWEEKLGEQSYSTLLKKHRGTIFYGPYTVPENSYFVMGDNRDNSKDSRLWKDENRFVPHSHIVGRAMFVWLSCEKTLPVFTFLCDPRHVRWKRFFHGVK